MMCDALKRGLAHHLPVEMRDGLEAGATRPRLPIPDSFDRPWRKELRFGPWLGVAPGAAHATKQAPVEMVQEILERIRTEVAQNRVPSPLGLVFFGDDTDRQVALRLQDHLHWTGPVLNLAGRLSLWETAVALKETTCLLSNDSSLGHIAEAVDTPTAILFGPTIESFGFAPRMRQSRAFSTLLGYRRPPERPPRVARRPLSPAAHVLRQGVGHGVAAAPMMPL
jgi:ADP-heptose:LPS heptosyltransferase